MGAKLSGEGRGDCSSKWLLDTEYAPSSTSSADLVDVEHVFDVDVSRQGQGALNVPQLFHLKYVLFRFLNIESHLIISISKKSEDPISVAK